MKNKFLILLAALLFVAFPVVAQQKFACVNTDYVLRSIPDYANAQKRLDKYVQDWQKELEDKQSEIENLRAEYEQESYLLPDNLKKRRQEEIKAEEQELRNLQQQRFGTGGDLDKKRAELLKPVQDRVYAAIERIAQEKNYGFVFDKAGSPAVLFANKKFDISDDVLESLGYKPGASQAPVVTDEPKKRPSNPEMRQRSDDRRAGKDVREMKPKKL